MKKVFRKLDNSSKIFSLEDKKNNNTFRLSVVLKEKVNPNILEFAVIKALEKYPSFKVKIKSGLFWSYLGFNDKNPIIKKEDLRQCNSINLKENNDYLFKVTYFSNKVNLDVFHVLTDGIGVIIFLKDIICNYLNEKYNLNKINEFIINIDDDQHIKNFNNNILYKEKNEKAFLIKEKSNLLNNKTYHYILDLNKFKNKCRKNNVSITEYLTAIYIYAIYNSIYDKTSNKDIVITLPIDLRKYYKVESLSNFFTYTYIEGDIVGKEVSFDKILMQVHNEFKDKLTFDKIKGYLYRDVKLGTNFIIGLIPQFIKKGFMRYLFKFVSKSSTATLSNIGPIKFEKQYRNYIDNILVLVSLSNIQKVKCTICSYENKLNVTINSNLINNDFEDEFCSLLKEYII